MSCISADAQRCSGASMTADAKENCRGASHSHRRSASFLPESRRRPVGRLFEGSAHVGPVGEAGLIGDGFLPRDQRRTVCNVTTYEPVLPFNSGDWAQGSCPTCAGRHKSGKPAQPRPSGLLGPVRITQEVP
jgi:hypothetical protein